LVFLQTRSCSHSSTLLNLIVQGNSSDVIAADVIGDNVLIAHKGNIADKKLDKGKIADKIGNSTTAE
jgi:hypothetical protein